MNDQEQKKVWDFEDEEIERFLPLLLSPDVQALIAEATRIKNAR